MLDDILNKLKNFPSDELVRKAVEKNEKFGEDLQRDQLDDGVDSKDTPITPGYAASTRAIKRRKGQSTSRVNLKDTGRFHARLKLQTRKDGYQIDGPVSPTTFLVARYGDVLGHTPKSVELMSEKIKPDLQDETHKYLTS